MRALLIAAALAACAAPAAPSDARPGTAVPSATVLQVHRLFVDGIEVNFSGDPARFRSDCAPADVARIVDSFVRAFDDGDADRAAEHFVAGFQWFVADVTIYDRRQLPAFFRERHAQGERMRVLRLDVVGPSWHGGLDFAIWVARGWDGTVPDEQATPTSLGKGAVDCGQKGIIVFALGSAP